MVWTAASSLRIGSSDGGCRPSGMYLAPWWAHSSTHPLVWSLDHSVPRARTQPGTGRDRSHRTSPSSRPGGARSSAHRHGAPAPGSSRAAGARVRHEVGCRAQVVHGGRSITERPQPLRVGELFLGRGLAGRSGDHALAGVCPPVEEVVRYLLLVHPVGVMRAGWRRRGSFRSSRAVARTSGRVDAAHSDPPSEGTRPRRRGRRS